MNEFWLRLAGVPAGRIPEGASQQFDWSNAPRSWGVFVLIAAVLAGAAGIFYLYRRELETCPKPVRIVLGVLRTLTLLVLVAIYLGPVVTYTQRHQIDPFIVLGIDTSRSMSLADRYLDEDAAKPAAAALGKSVSEVQRERQPRSRIVEAVLTRDDGKLVRELSAKGKLRVVHFAANADVKETKPRYIPPELRVKKATVSLEDIKWPELRTAFYLSAGLVIALAIWAFVQSRALVALVGAVPLVIGYFSLTMFIEENIHIRPLVLMGLRPVDELLFPGAAGQAEEDLRQQQEAEDQREKEFRFDTALPGLVADGAATNYARAIRKGLESTTSGPVAAIVLIGDGVNTAGGKDYQKAAEEASERNVPILTVGVGDISKERRVDVAGVIADERVWRGDPFEIKAVIRSKGYPGRTVDVSLFEKQGDQPGDGRLLERKKDVPLPKDDDQAVVVFKYLPEKEGEFQYIVRIDNVPDPELEGKREESAPVSVLREKARVLLIAGSPTWEYRMVQVLLTRDKTIDLSCWLQSIKDMPQEGTTKIEQIPLSKEDLSKYDVVLLFDPDPNDFNNPTGGTTRWSETIKEFLGDGGGVLYMTGPKYAGQFLTDIRTQGISEVLPVRFDEQATLLKDYLTDKYNKAFPLRIVAANVDHAVMRFDVDSKATLDRWEHMPRMYWSFPAKSPKTAGRVLLEHSDPQYASADGYRPLLVTGQYGAGRTVYMGFNGTWRWRRLGKDGEFFAKFWVQTVRYLIEGRLMGSQKRGLIEISRDSFRVGAKVPVTATLKSPQGEKLTDPTVTATLQLHGEKAPQATFALKAVKDKPGSYQGEVEVRREGSSFVAIELPGSKPTEPVKLHSKNFRVEFSDAELEDRRLNKETLRNIADLSSKQYKGAYYEIDELAKTVAAVPDRSQVKVVPGRPIDLWDTNRLIFLLGLLLTIEWGTRKRFKLM